MSNPEVSILIVNYKTLTLTKLCLRLLRLHTDLNKIRVIVVDNNSQDESLDYLRSLSWITLIERKSEIDDTPALSHARALDLALELVATKYVLAIHTDTFVKHDNWLEVLLAEIEKNPNIAGVGSWKLESKLFIQHMLKMIERPLQLMYYKLIGKKNHKIVGSGVNHYFLRSHCALYKTDLLKKLPIKFADLDGCAGKAIHRQLLAAGYNMIFLPDKMLLNYIEHFNHATMILHPELGACKRTIKRGRKRIQRGLNKLNAAKILADVGLD